MEQALSIIKPGDYNQQIKQHWKFTMSHQKNIGALGKKILGMVLAQIKQTDKQLQPYYHFRVSELVQISKTKNKGIYSDVAKAINKLSDVKFIIQEIDGKKYTPRHLLDTTAKENPTSYHASEGMVTIRINPALEEYFIGLANNYNEWSLASYMKLSNWYAMRIFEILNAFRYNQDEDGFNCHFDLDTFRRLMDLTKDKKTGKTPYKSVNLLVQRTIIVAQEQLNDSPFQFEFEKVFGENSGKGRKPLIGFRFKITGVAFERPKDFVQRCLNHPDTAHITSIFKDRYKFSDRFIKEISQMGREKLNELIQLVNLKKSNDEIKTTEQKYAYGVFKREFRKYTDEKIEAL
ncbi:replication initiation protein [Xanthovirga aplysinae]|uniref:replication initiation protein n=1 Tax=Xanthovirga aplysinae TaxID=2529853 RepID=UPI0012BC053E|nr:replication initiation protein [Xanthovirga aplysinae]MTI30662.1 RepB family plasmid replication initiator protein [Xanthovirga aplysinae]